MDVSQLTTQRTGMCAVQVQQTFLSAERRVQQTFLSAEKWNRLVCWM